MTQKYSTLFLGEEMIYSWWTEQRKTSEWGEEMIYSRWTEQRKRSEWVEGHSKAWISVAVKERTRGLKFQVVMVV